VQNHRKQLRDNVPPPPEPFIKNYLFSGGLAAGVLIDVVAVVLKRPAVALAGLFGFGAALVAVLQWISRDEADEVLDQTLRELKEHDDRIRRNFNEEQAPL